MKLKTYLVENNITLRDFSKKIDCSYAYLSNICRGALYPGRRLAREIEKWTDGNVLYEIKEKKKKLPKNLGNGADNECHQNYCRNCQKATENQ